MWRCLQKLKNPYLSGLLKQIFEQNLKLPGVKLALSTETKPDFVGSLIEKANFENDRSFTSLRNTG
jgi:hypothetical protein